jgi:hypothetical protein
MVGGEPGFPIFGAKNKVEMKRCVRGRHGRSMVKFCEGASARDGRATGSFSCHCRGAGLGRGVPGVPSFLGHPWLLSAGPPGRESRAFRGSQPPLEAAYLPPGPGKKASLIALNLILEKLRFLWRIVHERKFFSAQQHQFVCLKIDEIGRMAGAWLKSIEARKS